MSVLGDVIKSLGENSRNRTTAGHIPYRNSILTMVLKNSLGGNSRTVMVANVSPSSVDYEETISTLKYADNTKKIRLRVEANVISGLSASDGGAMQLVPVLQAEVKKLRELLQQQQIQQHKFTQSSHLNSGVSSVEMNNETLDLVDQMRARVVELEEQLMEREELIKNLMENSSVAPLNNEDEDSMSVITTHSTHTTATSHSLTSGHRSQPYVVLADDAIDTTLPRLINLNQDPLFSECLVYYIPHGQAIAGSSEADVDILLSGPDILAKHCCLHNDHDDVYIYPMSSTAKIYVNGLLLQQPVSKSTERYYLRHFDRVSMGKYHLFRFEACGRRRAVSPVKGMKSTPLQLTTLNTDAPGWDFAHDELMLYKDSTKLAPRSRSPRRGDTSGQFPPGYFTSIMNVVDLDSPNKISSAPKNHQVTSSRNIDLETYQEDIISLNETKPLTQRSPSDDWWDKVHQVVDNPTKVNTPAELRAMLRSVMESAEKQFDNAFSSIKTDTIEKKNQSEEEKTFKISPQISKSSDTEIPPPPPLLSTQRHSTPSDYLFNLSKGKDQQMSTQSQVSAIKLPTKIKLPSNDTKTVDILYAERKSLSSYVISQPESGIIHEDESSKIKTRNSLSSDAQLSTGSNTGGGHRYNSQKVDRIASSSTILFEDEASALQKDMLQMQQSLRERIQRYK